MWDNPHYCTFLGFTVVEIQNAHSDVLRTISATFSVLTLGNWVFVTTGKSFRCPGCLVIEISAETWFLLTGCPRPTISFFFDTTVIMDLENGKIRSARLLLTAIKFCKIVTSTCYELVLFQPIRFILQDENTEQLDRAIQNIAWPLFITNRNCSSLRGRWLSNKFYLTIMSVWL